MTETFHDDNDPNWVKPETQEARIKREAKYELVSELLYELDGAIPALCVYLGKLKEKYAKYRPE